MSQLSTEAHRVDKPHTAPTNQVPPTPTVSLHNEPVNILIVDDEPRNLTVLETILDDPRYRLVRATSADQALIALVGKDFAVLILDIRMPSMTGFELAHLIKQRKKTEQIPIIFLTAYYNEDQPNEHIRASSLPSVGKPSVSRDGGEPRPTSAFHTLRARERMCGASF